MSERRKYATRIKGSIMEEFACLFSIYPEYAYKILSGEKNFEYRKKVPALRFHRLVIYATVPVAKIIGEVHVDKILQDTPSKIWTETNKHGGIEKETFFSYFENRSLAYAYSLSNPILYKEQLSLSKIRVINAPQSFVYLDQHQLDIINEAIPNSV